uniref:cAMP-dependent protein kinase inhibitor beta n=1 Tax=Eptatretus burgeri TaxID=7764 RepID=A0A8C4N8R2_EPTBU
MTHMEPIVSDFAASGRSGRRNALPDILSSSGKHPAELPLKLSDLSVGGECQNTSQKYHNERLLNRQFVLLFSPPKTMLNFSQM